MRERPARTNSLRAQRSQQQLPPPARLRDLAVSVNQPFAVLSRTKSFSTHVTVDYVTGKAIGVSFKTVSGNRPKTFNNTLFLWQNPNQIPWDVEPLHRQKILYDGGPDGSTNIQDVHITSQSYIIGYAVGPSVSDICASAYISAENNIEHPETTMSLTLKFAGPTSCAVDFTTLPGYRPEANRNWAGIWNSSSASHCVPPKWRTEIHGNSSNGLAAFNNISLERDGTYTVGYFMSPNQSSLAATLTFTV